MPLSPTSAQSEASRLNGARSSGPATPEGKARSALNGTRHGLRGSTFALLPDEDPTAWAALLAGYLARFRPPDEAELACVERLAACDWREARLLRLETEMLFASRGDTSEPDPRLSWSRTLPRYAAAIRRDRKEALEQLELLRAARPRLPANPTAADAARFRWLAERTERLVAEEKAAAVHGTPEPEPAHGEPEPAPAATPVPSVPASGVTPEPERPLPPAPNRVQRRRLAALRRRTA